MEPPRLTSPLDRWCVKLRSGAMVDVAAHAVKEMEGFLVFVALAEGSPNFEMVLAAFPLEAVEDWGGGSPFDGTFQRVGPLR